MAESLKKGNKVFVEGRFRTREFEGRDGQKRTALEITADSIVNLERRGRDEEGSFTAAGAAEGGSFGGNGGAGARTPAPARSGGDDTELDDLPF
jgi:single-strand DNA-binding protein